MRGMRVDSTYIVQMETEPAVWTIREDGSEALVGLIVTYVDDVLVLAKREVVEKWLTKLRSTWETTEPEWIDATKGTLFLWMELRRSEKGEWGISQLNYTFDLLQRNLGKQQEDWGRRRIPISKALEDEDEACEPESPDPEVPTVEAVREAQRVVGELVWLVTRSRPDIMYALSRMAALSTKKPKKVLVLARQIWRYLAATVKDGLVFPREDQPPHIEVYTDASFGETCQGCVVVRWGRSPILWKSSRQTVLTTSTAGAELLEVMEGAAMAEAVRVVAEEMRASRVQCMQFTDSASALAIVTGESASWRTKHLRRRARFLRWRALRGDVVMRHLAGSEMIADLGTKALTAQKLQYLKELLGMISPPTEDDPAVPGKQAAEISKVEIRGDGRILSEETNVRQLQLAVLMALLVKARGQEDEELSEDARWFLILYTVVVVACTLLLQWIWGRLSGQLWRVSIVPDVSERPSVTVDLPAEAEEVGEDATE